MNIKSSIVQRAKERIARLIWQNVFTKVRERNFKYVLQRSTPARICFGSTLKRECLPIKGPAKSPLMRRCVVDNLEYPTPTTYTFKSSLLKNYPNQKGYGGLAYESQRASMVPAGKTPAVGLYEINPAKKIKKCPKPFNLGAKSIKRPGILTPAPGSYNFRKRNTKIPLNIPIVKTLCTPTNEAKCSICDEVPLGDYWSHQSDKRDMCRPCMQKEKESASMMKCRIKKQKRLEKLDEFCRMRHCGFFHQHNGTKAAVRIVNDRYLKIKFRNENYLNMFHY